jgi:hypothetical protein
MILLGSTTMSFLKYYQTLLSSEKFSNVSVPLLVSPSAVGSLHLHVGSCSSGESSNRIGINEGANLQEVWRPVGVKSYTCVQTY